VKRNSIVSGTWDFRVNIIARSKYLFDVLAMYKESEKILDCLCSVEENISEVPFDEISYDTITMTGKIRVPTDT